ncbi:hypothetical protein MCEREM21A_02172 [Sphingomonadaceae bacterium]
MRSYQAAMRELGNVDRREMGSWMNPHGYLYESAYWR